MKKSATYFSLRFGTVFVMAFTPIVSSISEAILIVQEDFDYPIGDGLKGQKGGRGWSSGWETPEKTDAFPVLSSQGVTLGGMVDSATAPSYYLDKFPFTRKFSKGVQSQIKDSLTSGGEIWFSYGTKGDSKMSFSTIKGDQEKDFLTVRKYGIRTCKGSAKDGAEYSLVTGNRSKLSRSRLFPRDKGGAADYRGFVDNTFVHNTFVVGRIFGDKDNGLDVMLWSLHASGLTPSSLEVPGPSFLEGYIKGTPEYDKIVDDVIMSNIKKFHQGPWTALNGIEGMLSEIKRFNTGLPPSLVPTSGSSLIMSPTLHFPTMPSEKQPLPEFEDSSLGISCSVGPDSYISDFRVGTSPNEVLWDNPEPCTLTVLGIGSLLLLRRRKKNQKKLKQL